MPARMTRIVAAVVLGSVGFLGPLECCFQPGFARQLVGDFVTD
jgi:hypothetical protein